MTRSPDSCAACRSKGVSRQRRKVFTTRQDPDTLRAPDLVNRNFTADRPDALWVTDLTYVPTRTGMAYVCFIVDAFSRRIVGWRAASIPRPGMVQGALEIARRCRGSRRLVGLVTHSDAGSQSSSERFTVRLDEIGARPSIGKVADWFYNALAETTNGLYEASMSSDLMRLGRRTASMNLNLRRCRGSTGSARTASTATAARCRPPGSK